MSEAPNPQLLSPPDDLNNWTATVTVPHETDTGNLTADQTFQYHTTPHPNAYPCTLCASHFATREEQMIHLFNDHFELDNFLCHHCDNSFRDPAALDDHAAAVHHGFAQPPEQDDQTRGPEYCSEAGCTFSNDSYLGMHLHILHGHVPKCTYCNQKFIDDLSSRADHEAICPLRFPLYYEGFMEDGTWEFPTAAFDAGEEAGWNAGIGVAQFVAVNDYDFGMSGNDNYDSTGTVGQYPAPAEEADQQMFSPTPFATSFEQPVPIEQPIFSPTPLAPISEQVRKIVEQPTPIQQSTPVEQPVVRTTFANANVSRAQQNVRTAPPSPSPQIPQILTDMGYLPHHFDPRTTWISSNATRHDFREFPRDVDEKWICLGNPKDIAYDNLLRLAQKYSNTEILNMVNHGRPVAVIKSVSQKLSTAVSDAAQRWIGGEEAVREWIKTEREKNGVGVVARGKKREAAAMEMGGGSAGKRQRVEGEGGEVEGRRMVQPTIGQFMMAQRKGPEKGEGEGEGGDGSVV